MAFPLVRSLFLAGFLSILLLVALQEAAQAEPVLTTYYGTELAGNPTASGEPFDPYGLTAAHPYLPFDTVLTATLNGRSVTVRVNDRGPFVPGRGLDLSLGAAQVIGLTEAGPAVVEVEPGETPEVKPPALESETTEPASPTRTPSSAGELKTRERRSNPSVNILIPPGKRIVDSIDEGFWPQPRKVDVPYEATPDPDAPLATRLAKEREEQMAQTLYARLRILRRRSGALSEEDIL
jgi:rare lipoprotein A